MAEEERGFSYLDLINRVDNWPQMDFVQACHADDPEQTLYRFLLPGDHRPYGFMRSFVVAKMPWTADFVVSSPSERPRTVRLVLPLTAEDRGGDNSGKENPGLACSRAFEKLFDRVHAAQTFPEALRPGDENRIIFGARWRIVFSRSLTELFGLAGEGVHLIMYVRDAAPGGPAAGAGSERLRVWVGRRALTVRNYPGLLDTSAAGAMIEDQSRRETVAREAWEEAGVPEEEVRRRARPVGTMSYINSTDGRGVGGSIGLMAAGQECLFEMEVGESEFAPAPRDGEVSEFRLMDVDEVKAALRRGEFKGASAMTMIAFMVKHGAIAPDDEPDYAEINTRLVRRLPMPTRWGTWLEAC